MKKNINEEVLRIREVMGYKEPLNEQTVKRVISPTTQYNWDNLSGHLESTYGYTIEGENKLTYNFDNLVTMVVAFTPIDMNTGRMSMEIKFNDPNIIKVNGPSISTIQTLLKTKLVNNTIMGNSPEGYLTQTIDKVANILFNVITINGQTMANTPSDGGKIKDYGDYNTHQSTRKN
jgi:hypothetical protein